MFFTLCMIAFCQSVLLKKWWWWWWTGRPNLAKFIAEKCGPYIVGLPFSRGAWQSGICNCKPIFYPSGALDALEPPGLRGLVGHYTSGWPLNASLWWWCSFACRVTVTAVRARQVQIVSTSAFLSVQRELFLFFFFDLDYRNSSRPAIRSSSQPPPKVLFWYPAMNLQLWKIWLVTENKTYKSQAGRAAYRTRTMQKVKNGPFFFESVLIIRRRYILSHVFIPTYVRAKILS